jgi:hypothetical protein
LRLQRRREGPVSRRLRDRVPDLNRLLLVALPGLIHRERRVHFLDFADLCVHHNPATPAPNSRLNRCRQWLRDKNHKGTGMIEPQDNAALEREEITIRVANFKATQQRFERERDEFFVATLGNARHSESPRLSPEHPPFWS